MLPSSRLARTTALALAVIWSAACQPTSSSGASTGGAVTPAATMAASTTKSTAPLPSASTCPTAPPRVQPTAIPPLGASVAPFTGSSGANQVFARVEAVDVPGQRLTVTFPRSATGGGASASSAAPANAPWEATLRITPASVLQQVATTTVPLAATAESTATSIRLAAGAPAVTARSAIVLIGLDECKLEIRQPATIAQSASAGAGEWALTGAITRTFPVGTAVIAAEVKPIALAALKPGDLLSGIGGPFLFGLTFSGASPNFVLVRLLRACQDDPCPRIQV